MVDADPGTGRSDRVATVARTFDALAPVYDRSGVPFFGPIAAGLISALALTAGERVVDIGCGTGAVLTRAASAVAPGGTVTGCDVSPAMVAAARETVRAAGLTGVEVVVDDAQSPRALRGPFDVVAASMVLFFLPDPGGALAAWARLMSPDGRLGVATFAERDDTLEALDSLFSPYLPPTMLDARTSGARGPFASDAGMADLVERSGFARIRTETLDLEVRFADVAQWEAFSRSTGQAAMWGHTPQQAQDGIRAAAPRHCSRPARTPRVRSWCASGCATRLACAADSGRRPA